MGEEADADIDRVIDNGEFFIPALSDPSLVQCNTCDFFYNTDEAECCPVCGG